MPGGAVVLEAWAAGVTPGERRVHASKADEAVVESVALCTPLGGPGCVTGEAGGGAG